MMLMKGRAPPPVDERRSPRKLTFAGIIQPRGFLALGIANGQPRCKNTWEPAVGLHRVPHPQIETLKLWAARLRNNPVEIRPRVKHPTSGGYDIADMHVAALEYPAGVLRYAAALLHSQ